MEFKIEHSDKKTSARAGVMHTGHGTLLTPVFMPVGTQATVKTLTSAELHDCQTQILLSNTYHLYLRPGDSLIRTAGGLHRFMNWDGPILTDSGGFQVFSLSELRKILPEGVRFRSHIDGSYHTFTPESVIDIQRNLGSDIMMVLDECSAYPCTLEEAVQANNRTINWAEKSVRYFGVTEALYAHPQFLFGIVQGSVYESVRKQSIGQLIDLNMDGYAIGGLAVGEPKQAMRDITAMCAELLPSEKPRYLMGVGKPEDIVNAIASGVDMFDCVIPTRNGRKGTVYTWQGKMILKNSQYREDFMPIDDNCRCYTCRNHSRAYLRHLFTAGEILGMKLATLHNIYFYLDLVRTVRKHIIEDEFFSWKSRFDEVYPSDH